MEKGLGQRWAGTMFPIFLSIAFGFAFNSVQSNTITGARDRTLKREIAGLARLLVIGPFPLCRLRPGDRT
jgi:Na+/alanine symporter